MGEVTTGNETDSTLVGKNTTVTPLPVRNRLAGNPTQPPKYAIEAKLKNGLRIKLADPRATRAMVALMDMQAVMGGAASHWGGPSALAELMSAAYGLSFLQAAENGQQWHSQFHIINDAGHCENGLYALKANYNYANLTLESLKGFRSIDSGLTGHGEVHLFPEGVYLSNGPLGSSVAQAQGLCFGDKLAGNSRMTVLVISDGACMEGEAKEALAAIPGFAANGKMNPFVMILSDNNTKLSGRIDSQSYSMQPTFESLTALGWNVIKVEQGNNLQACVTAMEEAYDLARLNPEQPVAIHAKTVKGFGVKSTASSSSGGHGFPLAEPKDLAAFVDEIYNNTSNVPTEFSAWITAMMDQHAKKLSSPKPAVPSEKVQTGVSNALIRKKKEGLPVISISSDLPGSTGVAGFQKEFPGSTQDVGVSESNMVSMAAGLSKAGYIPVVDTFAQFGVTKGALPFMMASLSEAPMIAIFSHAGFQDAADGASHQALSYMAMTSSIPYTDTYCLACSDEADSLVGQAVDEFYRLRKDGKVPTTKIFFLGRENFPRYYGNQSIKYELGKAKVIFSNVDQFKNPVTIVAAGAMLGVALDAAKQLADKNQGCIIVNPCIINKPDVETIADCLRKTRGRLITIEDHQVVGGMGSLLCHALLRDDQEFKVISFGVNGDFGQSAYKASELYKKHGLTTEAILKAAHELI